MCKSVYKYTGYTPVKVRDEVELLIDDEWVTTKVRECLADQFIAKVAKRERFVFYKDKGATWRRKTSA